MVIIFHSHKYKFKVVILVVDSFLKSNPTFLMKRQLSSNFIGLAK